MNTPDRYGPEQESLLYEELTRINNEFARAQRELAKQNIELDQLNRQKNQFLGMAAHDLRTPLNVILLYSDFLLEEAAHVFDEEHVRFIGIIKSSVVYMLRLVDEFLDVSAIEAGKIKLDLQQVDLVFLVQNNLMLNKILAEKKHIQLTLSYDEDIPDIVVDVARIDQVLNNLIVNAIKFSFPHSTIELKIGRNEDQVLVMVRDEGKGIATNQIERLFDPFETAGATSTIGEKGTGLGLAIVRRIIEEHRGQIWVESEIGSGATFYVALPISRE